MISDVRRIHSLFQVSERGTITAAAKALGYTPSAISQQLSALEAEVGAPVLERRGRNVVLTDAGWLVLEHGREALAALERAEAAVAELHGEPGGVVRIGALASATASIVPAALQSALAAHPRLEPEVFVHPLDRNVEELRLGAIDLAVDQSYDSAPHNIFDDFDQTVLLREPLVLMSPASLPYATVADAKDADWIASPEGSACGRSTRTIAARYGIAPQYRYDCEDHFAIVRLVAAGLAVAIVPTLALLHPTANVHVSVVPDAHRTISALTRPAARARPAITTMIDHLLAAAKPFENLTVSA